MVSGRVRRHANLPVCLVLLLEKLKHRVLFWSRGVHLESTWSPPGVHLESTWSPPGVHLESTWSPPGVHLDSIWIPSGFHLDSRWSPDGVQMDFIQNCTLWSFPYGVQVESTWNLWVRVKYTVSHSIH